MSYKVFVNGYPLNASELNQYLMSQTIAVFVDATARDAAIETPVEGQFAYLTGSDALMKFDGTDWVDALAVAPVVSEQTGTTYTVDANDAQSTVLINNASGTTVTIADVLSPGERIDFVQKGAGAITFVADTGLTLNSKDGNLVSAGQYSGVTVICEASNTYYLIGNLTA